jgi:rsbT co-antagonist protein RsbR
VAWAHACKDGGAVECEWFHEALVDEHGEAAGVLCFGHDVTARAQAAAQHRLHEIVLRAIVENLPIAVWATDSKGIYTYHEGKALAAAGFSAGQLIGKDLFELYGRGATTEPARQALAGESIHEFNELHGVHWENWMLPVRDGRGEVTSIVGVSLDVSWARRTEEELRSRIDLIERQQRVIRELSTPILQVWDAVLALPMIGVVDSARAAEVMDGLLEAVVQRRARYAILDLTGVEAVDTKTAAYLIDLIRAIRLLGADGIITGIRPTVAQTIVMLGVELGGITTLSDLQAGLKHCIAQIARRA